PLHKPQLPAGLTWGDPTIRFEDMVARAAVSMESSSDADLRIQARSHADPARREHALYQYLARHGVEALPLLREALFEDEDTDLRINVLWALEWLPSADCRGLALGF